MRNEYLNKVEDNASVCTWSEKTQLEKGDSVTEGYISELWDFTRVNSTQNKLQELRNIWAQWDDKVKQLFYQNCGDLPFLLDVKVDRHLFRAMVQFWNPAFSSFTFGDVDLAPTLEENTTLLRCPRIQGHKLMLGLLIFQLLRRNVKKKVDVLALGIYGMVIFPKALGHIDEAVADLFDRLTPVKEGSLDVHSCWWSGFIATSGTLIKFLVGCSLKNLREEDIMWKAPWLVPSEVLYRCGNFDWIPLPGIWRAVRYTLLLVLRQYQARQFIPATQGLAQSDFSYKGDHYKKRMREIFEAWKKPFYMKILTEGSTSTLEYKGWFSRRVNDNVPRLTLGVARSLRRAYE
ncbi:hypothetical protein CXB51_031929 [Gossypium anomalum]|uniref:DUF7745 domain-containing protein n=1 Tax=Gossypium anomalum TaxID=47600 RepID=A0A8J5Y1M9_9ROSI|nr:hypothetical protein CXB51_031929 [Gossypium anomalum]